MFFEEMFFSCYILLSDQIPFSHQVLVNCVSSQTDISQVYMRTFGGALCLLERTSEPCQIPKMELFLKNKKLHIYLIGF